MAGIVLYLDLPADLILLVNWVIHVGTVKPSGQIETANMQNGNFIYVNSYMYQFLHKCMGKVCMIVLVGLYMGLAVQV